MSTEAAKPVKGALKTILMVSAAVGKAFRMQQPMTALSRVVLRDVNLTP